MKEKTPKSEENKIDNQFLKGRRNALKTLASVPVLGVLAYGIYKKQRLQLNNKSAASLFNFKSIEKNIFPINSEDQIIRIGIIGTGRRGTYLMRSLGFAAPQYLENIKNEEKNNSKNTLYQDFLNQDDLKIKITGICDIYDINANKAIKAGSNTHKEGLNGHYGEKPKRYLNYKEMLKADDIDAVIIATADHWHGTIAMDAVMAGKHVYLEKPMTWTLEETYMLRDLVRNSHVVFQLGHQNRQIEANKRARDIINKGILGPISLIETSTNRNDPTGAWVYPIDVEANKNNIDWEQFKGNPQRIKEYINYMNSIGYKNYLEPEKRNNFSSERFFRWRCWWDYGLGLSGDLLTHEYDTMNHILDLGIPSSAISSGDIYYYNDGRTVPDVMQTVFEFKERKFSMLYTASLANQHHRSPKIMGHDGTLEIGNSLTLTIDPGTTQHREKIKQGVVKDGTPAYQYISGHDIDALSSATELYFAQRGLLYSYVDGKRYDTAHLHLREWLSCIRKGGKPSCGIDEGFQEAIAAHMASRAYLENRKIFWDADKEIII